MSNGADTLVSRVVMAVGLVAPVAVEFMDTKQRKSNVANVLVRPLEEIEAQSGLAVKLQVRKESSPCLPSYATSADVIKIIIVAVTQNTGSIFFSASVVRGPTV